MPASNWDSARSSSNTVAGFFTKPEDAHRAINELIEEGFDSSSIGAAFHSGSPRASAGSGSGHEEVNDLPVRTGYEESQMRPAGGTSGTEAVSPWGLFTGGGTPFAGAPRPGPITGSDIPPSVPRELPSNFASEHAYSGSAFESSFRGMGVPPDHARRLARELGDGGAVVTVKAGTKASAAEAVMQRNHGMVRYESAPEAGEAWTQGEGPEARVQVFGEVHRVYSGQVQSHVQGYVPGSARDQEQKRKAS